MGYNVDDYVCAQLVCMQLPSQPGPKSMQLGAQCIMHAIALGASHN